MEVKLTYDVDGGRTEREKTLCIILNKTQLIFLCICIGFLDVRVIPMMILFLWQRKFWVRGIVGGDGAKDTWHTIRRGKGNLHNLICNNGNMCIVKWLSKQGWISSTFHWVAV